ncbi:MAG: GIN domain-containing protein [Saprospiraceae bacterium]
MNKILNINLGGFAFTIDDDAFEYLSAYLDSIRRRFSASEGRDEILNDIENRLGELLTAEMGSRSIVMLPDVEAAVAIMGKPEDFGGEPIDNRRAMGSNSGSAGAIRTGKRLFRDEEDKIAGGVCSGLTAYFGIADPVWMRLVFVLLTFLSAGFWIPAYILLWILVPPARTAAERLAMRGEPINVDNIAREIEDGFERLGDKVNQYGAPKKKSGINGLEKAQNALSGILGFIGSTFGLVVQLFAKFFLFILFVFAVILLLALFIGWIASFWGLMAATPYVDFFSPFSKSGTFAAMTGVFVLFALPSIGLGLLIARLVFKFRAPGWLGLSMTIAWFITLFAVLSFGGLGIKSFRHSRTQRIQTELGSLPSDTLRIHWATPEDAEGEDLWINGDGIRLHNGNLQIRDYPELRIRVSQTGNFAIQKNITARGETPEEAQANAGDLVFEPELQGDALYIPNFYTVPKGKKFRVQDLVVTLLVPPGKYIALEEGVNVHVWDVEYADPNSDYRIGNYPGMPFRMTQDGLVCTDCPHLGDADYRGGDTYDAFVVEGKVQVEIRKADRFSVRKEGPESELQKVDILRTNEKMTITTNGKTVGPQVKIWIEAPTFTDLLADNTGEITIRGFDEDRAAISARGASRVLGYFDAQNLEAHLNGPCSLELFGRGAELEASLSDGARLLAAAWRADRVDVSAYNGAQARVFARENARIDNDSESTVKLEGSARRE